jgi:hypothetical protein
MLNNDDLIVDTNSAGILVYHCSQRSQISLLMDPRSPQKKKAVILTFQIVGHQSTFGRPSVLNAMDQEPSIAASEVGYEHQGF